jgi:hypothetical protein|tara:strand:+ start:1619 stop:1795 length:177 start_codon:yes stop_codon:yes gene_type:complete
MTKKNKKEVSSEEVKEEAPVEEPQPKPKEEGRKIRKEIEGVGYTNIVYDNGEVEKRYH